MAGIGFELKKLFQKSGMFHQLKAYAYSTTVIVGPMLLTMILVLGIQMIMMDFSFPYYLRQLFISGVIYAFIFSYLIVSIFSMLITRTVSDRIFLRKYDEILPIFYRALQLILPIAAILGAVYIVWVPLSIGLKLTVYLFYMELTLIWTLSTFISAAKEYEKITYAFVCGFLIGLIGTYVLFAYTNMYSVESTMIVLVVSFLITIIMLWWNIETLFYPTESITRRIPISHLFRYPSLGLIGFIGALGLFSHQFIEWFGPSGVWIEGSYRLAPRYDVAVYYAFLSILPTLVTSVVNLETNFYKEYKRYYELVIQQGTIHEVHKTQHIMSKVLTEELTKIMGIQLLFSIMFIVIGYRFLPLIGFTILQIEIYSILVMGFYLYSIFTVITVILLYFDDRKGTFVLVLLFTSLTASLSYLLLPFQQQGLSFFLASLVTIIFAFMRLSYMLRNLHYYTFSAQPLKTKRM